MSAAGARPSSAAQDKRHSVAEAAKQGRLAAHGIPQSQAWVQTLFIRRCDAQVSGTLAAFLQMVKTRYQRPARL